MELPDIPASCTLELQAAQPQAEAWHALLVEASLAEQSGDGLRLTFPIALADRTEDLALREAACCAFLTVTTLRTPSEIVLEVSADDDEGRRFISELASAI